MNKLTLFAILFFSILFTACEKIEQPGEIPGMGNASGELEVEPFEFAKDIKIIGEITGYSNEAASVKELKSTMKTYSINEYGSGGQFVSLKFTLKNENLDSARTMYFPQGLICKVDNGDYQNGILLQWTWVTLNPGEEREITLDLMCINKGKDGSDAFTNYDLKGVTTSDVIWEELLKPIGLKKVNIEYYLCRETGKLSANYDSIASVLQDAVWSLTNGSTGLSAEQKEFINALPEIESGSYPKEITTGAELPKSYDEYDACPGAESEWAEGSIMHQNYKLANNVTGPRIDYEVENAYITTISPSGEYLLNLYFTTNDSLKISFKRSTNDENFHSYATSNIVDWAMFNNILLTSGKSEFQIQLQPTGDNLFRSVINLNNTSYGSFNCVYWFGIKNIPLY